MAALAGAAVPPGQEQGQGQAVVHGVSQGMALTLREGICVFYDLEQAQIHVLQEEGQEKSSESKATEKPPDVLLMEVPVKMEKRYLSAPTITPIRS